MLKRFKDLKLVLSDAPLRHPIVAVLQMAYGELSQGASEEAAPVYYQVLERCDRDLHDALNVCNSGSYSFSEPLARFLFRQIIKAVQLCHEKGIHHRDLKCENILLKDLVFVKVTDFGTGTDITRSQTRDVGTPNYSPHWELSGAAVGEWYDGDKFDIFQCGALLFNILCVDQLVKNKLFGASGKQLWSQAVYSNRTETFQQQCERTRSASGRANNTAFWALLQCQSLSESVRDLLNAMLDCNPERRIGLEEVLSHPWMCEELMSEEEAAHEMDLKLHKAL